MDFPTGTSQSSPIGSSLHVNPRSMHDNPEKHHQNSDVSPTEKSPPQMQSQCIIPNQILKSAISHFRFLIQPICVCKRFQSKQAHAGLFLDICAGSNRPLSSAIMQAGGTVCTFDILVHKEDNLLNDGSYEALLRLSCSRQVRYGCGSPSCCEYSRLKLKPGGPKALRTLEYMDGVPGLTCEERTRVQESAIMLTRTIICLRLIYLAGGHCHLEQPTNAMSWMEPETQDFVAQVGIFCIVMAACAYDQSWDKSWMLSSSLEDLTQMGVICKHPRGTHESVIGTKAPDGSFNSRKTSEYPKKLCQEFAKIVSPLIQPGSQELTVEESLSLVPLKDLWETPWSSEDGGVFILNRPYSSRCVSESSQPILQTYFGSQATLGIFGPYRSSTPRTSV